jgi:hypothetical protein
MLPAMANELLSTPKYFKKNSPANKKPTIKTPEAKVTLPAWISGNFFFSEINTGTDPNMSMTANKVNATVMESWILNIAIVI